MTEELLQTSPYPLGRYVYYKLGATNLRTLRRERVITATIPEHIALKKPDGLIVSPHSGVTKAYIEYKPPNEFRTSKQRTIAIDQQIEAARHLCKLLVVTDGEMSIWINTLTANEISDQTGDAFSPFNAYRLLSGDLPKEKSNRARRPP